MVALLDSQSCELAESYEYTVFGEETIFDDCGDVQPSSRLGNPWRFAEKRVNEISGYILFGLRFYDPSIGRWISQDPAGFIGGSNLYAYVHNNPI